MIGWRLHSTIFSADDQKLRDILGARIDSANSAWYTRQRVSWRDGDGGMAERLKATVLKTVVALWVTGGSNPSPSALKIVDV